MAYASGSDLLVRYDDRIVGDLVQDDDTRNGSPSTAVTELLETASEYIDSALLTSGRYSEADLSALNGDRVLKDMACRLAMSFLWERRGLGVPSAFQPSIDRAFEQLDLLRKGELVLPSDSDVLAGKVDAGVADVKRFTAQDREITDGMFANVKTFPKPGTRRIE